MFDSASATNLKTNIMSQYGNYRSKFFYYGLRKPLFDKYEREFLKMGYLCPASLALRYSIAKFKQAIFKQAIKPFCEPIINFLAKFL